MNKRTQIGIAAVVLSASLLIGQDERPFPSHWGKPPEIQTRDYVELPAGYGHGSSTLAHWITANLEKDESGGSGATLYENNFERSEVGMLPEEFQFAVGEFAVKADGTNKVLELPGAPLDSFSVQFGPALREDVAMAARIFGTNSGRRCPTFGIGVGGGGGYKLQVSPGKQALELLQGDSVKSTRTFGWKPGEWTQFRLEVRKLKEGQWTVEGKAWQGDAEPKDWMIIFHEKEAPLAGRSSLIASPFAGTPILFDDLVVTRLATQP